MAKHGMKLMDSDMHIIEPPDLWERYIDPAFKARAPKGWPGHENPSVLEVDGTVYPKSARTPAAHYQTMYDKVSGRYTHAIARGYDDPVGQVVSEVNGVKVRNLRHLVETLRDCKDDYLTFRFAETGAEVLVFARSAMDRATTEILEDNGISPARRGSNDMLKLWKATATSP